LLNSGLQSAEKPLVRLLKGGPKTTRRSVMKLRLYRMAFTASVVAVFLQGLGAGMKWS
jgi:hypothetical protein